MPSLIQVGIKFPSKKDGEGLFGDKKTLLNIHSCSSSGIMSSDILLLENQSESMAHSRTLKSIYCHTIPLILLMLSLSLSASFSFPLSLQLPAPPPRLFSISPYRPLPLLSVTLPFILYRGEGRHLILGYLPISMMAASLIIRSSSLRCFSFNSGRLHHTA